MIKLMMEIVNYFLMVNGSLWGNFGGGERT